MKLSPATTIVRLLTLSAILLFMPISASAIDNGDADFAKGWDLLKLKKYKEARTALESGMKKNQSNALAHFYLADACRGLKDWTCAEEHYETSLELDSKSSVTDLAKARLRKAKVWRLLENAKRTSEEGEASPEKYKNAHEMLEIAKALGFEDEQQATYDLLTAKLQAKAEKEVTLSGDETLAYIQETVKQTFSMPGSWARRYSLDVSQDGMLSYSVEGTKPREIDDVFTCHKNKDERFMPFPDYIQTRLDYKVHISLLDPSDVQLTQKDGKDFLGIVLNCKKDLTCVNLHQTDAGQCSFQKKFDNGWRKITRDQSFNENFLLSHMRILLGGNMEPTEKLVKAFSHLIKKSEEEAAQSNKNSPF